LYHQKPRYINKNGAKSNGEAYQTNIMRGNQNEVLIFIIIDRQLFLQLIKLASGPINVIMDIRKLIVNCAKLSQDNLVRFRLNYARNDEKFTKMLKRLDLEIEEDENFILEENIHNNYICVNSVYKEIYLRYM